MAHLLYTLLGAFAGCAVGLALQGWPSEGPFGLATLVANLRSVWPWGVGGAVIGLFGGKSLVDLLWETSDHIDEAEERRRRRRG